MGNTGVSLHGCDARDNLSRQGDWECPLLRGDDVETPGLQDFLKWEFLNSSLQTAVPTFKNILGKDYFREINFYALSVHIDSYKPEFAWEHLPARQQSASAACLLSLSRMLFSHFQKKKAFPLSYPESHHGLL